MKYPSIEVASLIAKICAEKQYTWNNTKIQKLLYCCYGCFLAAYEERLCDEYPRAWQYGPVFPRVFNHIHKKRCFPLANTPAVDNIPEEHKKFLEQVIDTFGEYQAAALSRWTHKEGSPWSQVVYGIEGGLAQGLNSFIPDDIIKDYFSENIVTKDEA